MENMQCHYGSQIQNSTLSFVKSYQLLKIVDHCTADCISGEMFSKASFLNEADHVFAELWPSKTITETQYVNIGITIDW